MGNCMKKQPAAKSDGGGWGSPATSPKKKDIFGNHRDGSPPKGEKYSGDRFSEKTATREVKIKISKKKLEELLGKTEVQGLTVEQMLAQLMSVSERFESHQRSWRPALRSIPE
ncbi:hypothetical protein L1987_74028 [Smallanthus sonchifolius]|uniref:Uncharacterized protein n=1 Tax=Smallanthus sonchifolius TaxID=185202 RepID=A0ACB9A350_9ASTR|nr:hypothetical protein L1987_74028 [Smallanthus sonchifolius]